MLGRINITRAGGGNSGVAPMNVKNLKIKASNQKLIVSWQDPDDTYDDDGTLLCTWKGTKVVYKAGSYPTSPSDGIIAVDNQERNKYKTNGFEISSLNNGTIYYFALFPYSDKNVYNKNEANRSTGTPTATKIYGIKRLTTSSATTWTRIEDADGLIANPIKSQSNLDSGVQNDFDSRYPWSDIITCNVNPETNEIVANIEDATFKWDGTNGQVMTKIPEFWYKREQKAEAGGTYEYIYIADGQVEGYNHAEEFMLGRYTISGSASAVYSRNNQSPLVNTNITNFRNYAQKLGEKWGIMDWRYFLVQLLYLVEYADYNSQNILGQGFTNGNSNPIKSGGCDTLKMKSGCLSNDGKHSVIYRGLEDIFGNIYQFVDGINLQSRQAYICYDPSKYKVDTFTGDYTKLSYSNATSNNYISKLGYDESNPLISFPVEANGSSSTYIPDYYYQSTGNLVAWVGGSWRHTTYAGLWLWFLFTLRVILLAISVLDFLNTSKTGVWGRSASQI